MVVVVNNQVLMVQQVYRGQTLWTFPGGAIEPGETPEAAAVREAFEETGLHVELLRPLCQTVRETGTGTYFCFLGRVAGGVVKLGRDPELPMDRQVLHDIRWFPLDEVQHHSEVARVSESLYEV